MKEREEISDKSEEDARARVTATVVVLVKKRKRMMILCRPLVYRLITVI